MLSCSGSITSTPERRSLFELIPCRPDPVLQHLPRDGMDFLMLFSFFWLALRACHTLPHNGKLYMPLPSYRQIF